MITGLLKRKIIVKFSLFWVFAVMDVVVVVYNA